jgi:AraC-like DNA-binding protein
MILTEMPDLPPRPETPENAAFRRDYTARWGKENTILCGLTQLAEYPKVMHPLSVKMAWGGREVYRLQRREVAVRDGSYLVLNDGDEYGSTLASERPATSFSVFLRAGLAGEIVAARRQGLEQSLDQPDPLDGGASFSSHLRGHDRFVSPRMRYMYERVMAGELSQEWLDEQAVLLLDDLIRAERASFESTQRIPAAKASTRVELARRLRLAADHIASHYEAPLTLETLAKVACMSTFHFLRYFALLHGMTPHAYLVRCRTAAARRMVAEGFTDQQLIAQRSGFGSRSSLYRALGGGSLPRERARPAALPQAAVLN